MLESFKRYSLYILIVLSIIEISLFVSWQILLGCTVLVIGWWSISKYILTYDTLLLHPIIFYMSLGVGIFYYYMPLIGTLIAHRPLDYKFQLPYQVFLHQLLYLLSYLSAFFIYTKSTLRPIQLRRWLYRLDFYKPLTDIQLWLMGIIGVFVFFYTKIIFGIGEYEAENVPAFIRFLIPFQNFIYAPLIYLFPDINISKELQCNKKNSLIIYFYMMLIVVMGILSNGRQFMVSSIILFGLLNSFEILKNRRTSIQVFTPKKIALGIVIAIFLLGPLAKMAETMVKIRGLRSKLSPLELFEATIAQYNLSDIQNAVTEISSNNNNLEWSEDYTGNVFFDRLCNLRIADMTLLFVKQSEDSFQERIKYLTDPILAQLPNPIIKLLGIKINKFDTTATSTISTAAVLSSTGTFVGGGKLVAAHTGTGIWLFGMMYPFVFIVIYIVLFFLFDSFHTIKESFIVYSPLLLLNLYSFFSYLNFKNGIISDLLFIGRGFIQLCFLYFIINLLTRYCSRLIVKI